MRFLAVVLTSVCECALLHIQVFSTFEFGLDGVKNSFSKVYVENILSILYCFYAMFLMTRVGILKRSQKGYKKGGK